MAFKPSEITRKHVLKGIEEIKMSGVDLEKGTRWEVIIEGKSYPPKEVMRFARKHYDGSDDWPRGGGWPTNVFLEKMGFEIREIKNNLTEKLIPYIEKYKVLISTSKSYSEIYKWELLSNFKKHWNLNTGNLKQMLEDSFPGNQNLWSSNQYYPIAMLKGFADTNSKGVINAISNLLDEKKDLALRISAYRKDMDALLKEDNQKRKLSSKMHYQDGRTIGLLLAFNYPKEHYLFKFNILKSFCEKFGLKSPKKGDIINQIIINDEISNHIRAILIEDEELLKLHNQRLSDKSYKEDDYHLLTQDFIYSTVTYLQDNMKYYVGGAYWDSETPQDQTERFIRDGVWQNGYDDKFNKIVNSIPEGSLIAIKTTDKKGNKMHIKAIGRVISNHNDGQTLDVEWEHNFNPFIVNFAGGYWETVKEVTNTDHINEIFFYNNEKVLMDKKDLNVNSPINQILYGPPGTGKTYNTVLEAAKIITSNEAINYDKALEVFKANLDNQIEFITFHQSYSYEDFIQGLRPDTENGKSLKFEKKDGIFKKIADRALFEYYIAYQKNKSKVKPGEIFIDANEAYLDFFNSLKKGQQFSTKTKKTIKITLLRANKNIVFEYENGVRPVSVSSNRLLKLYGKIPDIKQINNVNDDIRAAIGGCDATVYYTILNEFINFYEANKKRAQDEEDYQDFDYSDITEERKKEILSQVSLDELLSVDKSDVKNYVIIIDEINRANISRVFGELITLIEEDKRSHGKIPMRVTLPSGDSFIVPSNLYIIGTMNTADKSIALLDIALRRRFEFVPMYPQYEGLEQTVNDADKLLKINEAIISRKNHDFTIGHAYFMGEDFNLEKTINTKVIPLLLEYFMNSEKEVKEVLNEAGITIGGWPLKMIL